MQSPFIQTFTWYDTETTGIDHDFDQVLQAAFVKTDADLNIIPNSEKEFLCRPRVDVIPHPKAFLTHMMDIDELKRKGEQGLALSEFEMAQQIYHQFTSNPNNMVSGYNTCSFDDEVVRRMLYRNMLDPYAHEWRDGNGRFDAFKMIQLVYAMRPEMLTWRKNDKGADSLKLEHLVADNNLGSFQAHDAVGDVYATISLVKALKESNPKMFQFMLYLTKKQNVQDILFNQAKIEQRNPVINISTVYGKTKRYSSIVLPVITDLVNKNKILGIDLTEDPTDLLNMTSSDINKYLFTKREELESEAPRVHAVGIQTNKLPVVMELKANTLSLEQADKMDIDLDKVEANRQKILEAMKRDPGFIKRLQAGFSSELPAPKDPFKAIYAGFISDKDKGIRAVQAQRSSVADQSPFKIQGSSIYEEALKTDDKEKQFHLMLRAKWTNFGSPILRTGNLTAQDLIEFGEWMNYLSKSLFDGEHGLSFSQFEKEVAQIRIEMPLSSEQLKILDQLEKHVEGMKNIYQRLDNMRENNAELIRSEYEADQNVQRFNRIISKAIDSSSELSM